MSLFETLPQPFPAESRAFVERQLAERIQKGHEVALNDLVMANMREAVLYTRTVARNLDDGALISLCYETLVRNAKRFDPSRQCRFFAFAKAGLRGALYRKYNKEQKPSAPPQQEELGGTKKVAHIEPAAHEDHTPMEREPISSLNVAEPDYQTIFTRDRWHLVKPVVDLKCNDQERMVLNLSYSAGLNFQEIGDLLSVSRSAVQRTHARAIKKIRSELLRRKQLFNE